MILGPTPIKFQFIVEIQGLDGWRTIACCNSFDRSVRVADGVAEAECSMTRVMDLTHNQIVHERVGPPPERYWLDDYDYESQVKVDWSKEGF